MRIVNGWVAMFWFRGTSPSEMSRLLRYWQYLVLSISRPVLRILAGRPLLLPFIEKKLPSTRIS